MASEEVVRLAYDVIEPASAQHTKSTPLIFLHGMTSCRLTWHKLAQSFADKTGRKVYLLDARNHGDSPWHSTTNYQIMAKDIVHLMDELNIPIATLVGHSMGGKTAMALALSQPDRVDRLVVEDISPKPLEPSHKRFPHYFLKLLRESLKVIPSNTTDLEEAKRMISEYLHSKSPPEHASAPERRALGPELPLKKTDDGFEWKTNLDALDAMFYSSGYAKTILEGYFEKPILFVYGGRSVYRVIDDKEIILEYFPKAKFHCIEGATHLVHLEYPEEFFEATFKFLRETN